MGDRVARPGARASCRIVARLGVNNTLAAPGSFTTSPLFKVGRAQATLDRAKRAIAVLGEGAPFFIVYYGSDRAGGWQTLDRPLRTLTTLDRFALVTWVDGEARMRMLQVPELRAAMGMGESYLMRHGTRRDKIRILGNGVAAPVMKAVVETMTASKAVAIAA